jgi:hypothetical protein
MEECAFSRCRLKHGIPKVKLRNDDIPDLESFGIKGYKAGMRVCARHFDPNPSRQERSVRCTGQLLDGAFLSQQSLEKMDAGCRLKSQLLSQDHILQLPSHEDIFHSIR